MKNIQTLHSHTTSSDGELSHTEVLNACRRYGISKLAFTDHDTVISEHTLKDLKKYDGKVKWISGIEISSGLPIELGGKATSDLHIVGLFVDPTNNNLKKHCQLAKSARVERMQKMVKNLRSLGFNITEDDCLKASNGETVGRPHIVTAIKSKEENLTIMENIRKRMFEDSNKDKLIIKKYDEMMEPGEHQYPYVLFLTDNSYIPNIYVDYQYYTDMDKSVALIRNAGGLAILAHYFTCSNKINPEMLDRFFKQNRLDGAETVYGLFALGTGTEVEKRIVESSKIAREIVTSNDKLESGGADAHKNIDFEQFANSGKYANLTQNMAEKIIEKSKVDLTWSNLR